MNTLIIKTAQRLVGDLRTCAALCGVFLGWLTWEIAAAGDASAYRIAMTLVMLVAGALSFISVALHVSAAARRPKRHAVPQWIALLGSGVLVSIAALNGL